MKMTRNAQCAPPSTCNASPRPTPGRHGHPHGHDLRARRVSGAGARDGHPGFCRRHGAAPLHQRASRRNPGHAGDAAADVEVWWRTLPTTLTLAGTRTPATVFRAERLQELPRKVRGVPGLSSPLVGRSLELAQLLAAVEQDAGDGEGRFVLLSGSAGVGKSRLVAELHDRLAVEQGPTSLGWRGAVSS